MFEVVKAPQSLSRWRSGVCLGVEKEEEAAHGGEDVEGRELRVDGLERGHRLVDKALEVDLTRCRGARG